MKTTYDSDKNDTNVIKHGVSFEQVYEFDWDSAVIYEDSRKDYGEERRIALGFIGKRLHVLVYTPRRDTVRIISLRKANKRERKAYDDCIR